MASLTFGRIFKQIRKLKIKVMLMKIRFNHTFLATVGSALILGSIFIHKSPTVAFLGGACFGIIFLDMIRDRK